MRLHIDINFGQLEIRILDHDGHAMQGTKYNLSDFELNFDQGLKSTIYQHLIETGEIES